MTTREEIGAWFDRGVEQGDRYMIVMCDTYDWDDYPAYFRTEPDAQRAAKFPSQMQKVMEIYDLHGDRNAQLSKRRAFAFTV